MSGSLENKQVMASNIRWHLNHLGLNVKDFAKKLNFKYSTVLDWTNAKTYPRIDKIEIMANYFNVEKSDLVEQYAPKVERLSPSIPEKVIQLNRKLDNENHMKWILCGEKLLKNQKDNDDVQEKLFEYKVFEKLSAGTGFSYFNDGNYDTVFNKDEITHDFASWIYGDSMEPDFLNGEVALIKQDGFDYDGAIYAVDWDSQTYIKRVYRENDGLRLVSLNSKYADKFAPYSEDPRIVGKIIGHFMPEEY